MKNSKKNITLFHCLNAFREDAALFAEYNLKTVKMACSSMTKDVHLLRAFENGADAVVVLVCPEKGCRYAEGSIRARKRVDHVKSILDEIGMDKRRLSIFNTTASEKNVIQKIVEDTVSTLETIGPNPALNPLN